MHPTPTSTEPVASSSGRPAPPLRPFGRVDVPAPSGREAAAFDGWAIEELGVPQATLMENAGRSAAAILQSLHPRGSVVGLVGSGNNGGDALVLLRTLASWGRTVRAVRVADRGDDAPLLHGWSLEVVDDGDLESDEDFDRELRGAGVLVDGILGTGIQGAPRARQARAIGALNRAEAPILSLDVPSGIDAGSGAEPGEAVRADVTVAFGWPKLGSLLTPGRERSGRLVAVEIGFPPVGRPASGGPPHPTDGSPSMGCAVVTPAWARSELPRRKEQAHKYSVGSLLLHAGRKGMAGAAVMAGRAALRGGVGLLRIASDPAIRPVLQEAVPEAIFIDATDQDALVEAVEGSTALAAGPGIGVDPEGAAALANLLKVRGERPVVLDADALTLLGSDSRSARAPGGAELPSLGALGQAGPTLLTPHPGEMARISSRSKDEILGDPVGSARGLSGETGCAVLLKGLPSVVAPEAGASSPVRIDSQGTSDLAVGGMGDVLTGLCGALLAQGVGGSGNGGTPASVAGSLALHYSGRAATLAGLGAGLTPSDVIERIPHAFSEEGDGSTDLDLPFVVFDRDPPR